ncbi:MAG TPA: thioredoxin family protein [Methylomirabilota bacterium]|nr:thioredoxin family protein [Methylomirabilota bacterium]
MVTPARFGAGMTFPQYLDYIGTPENLARESGWWLGRERKDLSALVRGWYERLRLTEAQAAAMRWLAAQPAGPAKILAISEEWSSDCRRDVCIVARLAEAAGLELRIFNRDGPRLATGPRADPAESPNADLVNAHLHERDGQTFQSIPVVVVYTADFVELHRHIERPALYRRHRDRIVPAMQAPRPGETREQAWSRFMADWRAIQDGPFFPIWASATADEILSALHERLLGAAPR